MPGGTEGKLDVELIHQLISDFEVGKNVLSVIEFVQKVVELEDLPRHGGIRQGDGSGRLVVELDGRGGDTAFFEKSGDGV